jgi:hypothetical protein
MTRSNGLVWSVLLAMLLGVAPPPAAAQRNVQNEGNDPFTPRIALQLQDYAQPILSQQPGSGANQTNLRAVLPHDAFGWSQFMRATLPVASSTWGPAGGETGLGDLTIFNVPVFSVDNVLFGAGPLLVAPTASSTTLGDRKWQLGAEAMARRTYAGGIAAILASYQQALDGSAKTLTLQPLLFYNLADGYYLRSSGLMSADFSRRTTVLPVGLGLGRAIELPGDRVLNVFVEPQYSVIQTGAGIPAFQVYVGFNLQFARLRRPPDSAWFSAYR